MSELKGILHVKQSKTKVSYMVEFVNDKGKNVTMAVSDKAKRFRETDASEGVAVVLDVDKGQIARCVVEGKPEFEPQAATEAAARKPMRSLASQNGTRTASQRCTWPAGSNTSSSVRRSSEGGKPVKGATAPYNFIPFERDVVVPSAAATGPTYSGVIECGLEALTPLLVGGPNNREDSGAVKEFLKIKGKPVIPGTSIKGMLRSMIETMSFSRMSAVSPERLFWRNVTNPRYLEHFHGKDQPNPADDKILGGFLHKVGARVFMEPVRVTPASDSGRIPDGCSTRTVGDFGRRKGRTYLFWGHSQERIEIPEYVWHDFKEQRTPWQVTRWEGAEFPKEDNRENAMFYTLDSQGKINAIGLARYFRLAYDNRPADLASPSDEARVSEPDFATALFGQARDRMACKGRVSVSQVRFSSYEEGCEQKTVLGAPHPTCLPHYLVQPHPCCMKMRSDKNDPGSLVNYNEQATLRGRKMYWHRDVEVPPPPNSNEKVAVRLRPLKKGAQASFAVHVDRVTAEEFGALMLALDLPRGHAHKLGMGKPLGFGSVRITVEAVRISEDVRRYGSLCSRIASLGRKTEMDTGMREQCIDRFKQFVLKHVCSQSSTETHITEYDKLLAIRSLYAMTDYEHRPENAQTRTMALSEREANKLPEKYRGGNGSYCFDANAILPDALDVKRQADRRAE